MDTEKQKIKILVADDSEMIRDRIIQVLAVEGFETFEAENGEEVLQIATQVGPDLILLDVVMPDINGFEICTTLRSMENFSRIPILMLTVKASAYDISNAFKSGASDYIRKPFVAEELLLRIKVHLKNLKLQRHFESITELKDRLKVFTKNDLQPFLNQIDCIKKHLNPDAEESYSKVTYKLEKLQEEGEQVLIKLESMLKIK